MQVSRSLVAGLTACLASCTPSARLNHEGGAQRPKDTVVLLQSQQGNTWKTFCRGLSTVAGVITVEHCVEYATGLPAEAKLQIVSNNGHSFAIAKDIFVLREGSDWAVTDVGSRGLDFALLPIRLANADQINRQPLFPGEIAIGSKVVLGYEPYVGAQCTITAVCGSRIHYQCKVDTELGWSGSPVWLQSARGSRIIGFHSQGPGAREGVAVSWNTVIGRVRSLRTASDERELKQVTYAHRWTAGPICQADQSIEGVVFKPLTQIHALGLSQFDSSRFWMFDNNEACLINPKHATRDQCISNPDPRRIGGLNDVKTLADGTVLFIGPGGSAARVTLGWNGFRPYSLSVSWIQSPIGQVYDAALVGGSLFLAGQTGVCRATIDGSCQEFPGFKWHVNNLLQLNDHAFLAVGRYRVSGQETQGYCAFFSLSSEGWKQSQACERNRTVEQFRSPVLAGAHLVVASSYGSFFEVSPDGKTSRIEIDGLPGSGMEDAVRASIVLPEGRLAVVASDGSFRLLDVILGSPVRLRLHPGGSAFDRAIWLTRVIAGNGWVAIRGQDTEVQVATLAPAN